MTKITPVQTQLELSAALEVTKTLAFYGLLAGLRALGGDQTTRLKNLERSLKTHYSNCEINLPDLEAAEFREHVMKIVDELLERVRIDEQPFKSDSQA